MRTYIGLALSAVALSSCAISRQQEIQMGNDYATQINAELPLVRDAAVNNYLTALGRQLANATSVRDIVAMAGASPIFAGPSRMGMRRRITPWKGDQVVLREPHLLLWVRL